MTRLTINVLAVLLAALAAAAPATAGRPPVRGIDVSRFQGLIGWSRVAETEVRFAYIAASRGYGSDCTVVPEECGRDPRFDRNYRKAKQAGLRVGAYHRAFPAGPDRLDAKLDARKEANRFIAIVGKVRRNDLRPVLDVETPFKRLDEPTLRIWIRKWMKLVERKLGAKPLIYTNASSWGATGDTTWFATNGHPLWVADFDAARPQMPAQRWAGKGWTIWQYTSSGRVRGIDGPVDRDRLKHGFGKLEPR